MKKVLFISPTPTHPTNAGNRVHIKALACFFKKQQYRVDFLYLQYEDCDIEAMRIFFEDRLTVVPRNVIYSNKKTAAYIKLKALHVASKIYRLMQRKLGRLRRKQLLYNREVDSYFPHLAKEIIEQKATKKYDVVVCEYASMSAALELFDKDVFKILDTHDVFTDRYKIYLENDLTPEWVSLYQDQEKKALMRANLVLAASQNDLEQFTSLGSENTLLFNAIPEIVKLPPKVFEYRLLYIASGNDINISTLENFAENIFPIIHNKFPRTQLLVGGSVCEKFKPAHPNIRLCGKFENLKDFYSLGDIVINPETSGTGYKVKALEALAHGMPFVSTRAGATGAIEPFKDHLCIAECLQDFSKVILQLFEAPQLLHPLPANAHAWIQEHQYKTHAALKTTINKPANKSWA